MAIGSDGAPVPAFTMTIDALWQRLLAEQESGSLHKAEFDGRGVPLEVNWGSGRRMAEWRTTSAGSGPTGDWRQHRRE